MYFSKILSYIILYAAGPQSTQKLQYFKEKIQYLINTL